MPFRDLFDRYLPLVLEKGLNPEISFDAFTLERFRGDDYRRIADALGEAGRSVTFHAPFMDLRPGAVDPAIRRASVERIQQVFDLAPLFSPRSIVCHPSFDHRYYVSTEELWLENSIGTWTSFSRLALDLDTTVVLENVYERTPRPLERLLAACNSPRLRFCFDTGHCHAFSQAPLEDWMAAMSPYLFQLHLHDNQGAADEHLAVGSGTFPFSRLFHFLNDRGIRPILTLEAHSEKTLWESLANMGKLHGAIHP
jgi:sugar phosphate isomerase/epimerase